MTIDVTVKLLAAEIQTSVNRLLKQFADAGINKFESDTVTQKEKEILLAYLNHEHGNSSSKFTLQRKTRSTLNISSIGGKSKSVQIEIRKKHTYINHNTQEIQQKNKKEQSYHNIEIKKLPKIKIKNDTTELIKNNVMKKENNTHQDYKKITKLSQIKKERREIKTTTLKYKTEEEIRKKVEKEVKRLAKKVRKMAEENKEKWAKDEIKNAEVENSDYHITTSKYARDAEDENDAKVESERHHRIRNHKINKHKKNNKFFDSKINHEEIRTIFKNNKGKKRFSSLQQSFNKPAKTINRDVVINETITVSELANKMAVKSSQVIKLMMKLGEMVTINQIINQETAELIAKEMGHKVILRRENELEESLMNDRDTGAVIKLRAPVVTIMGHVDHGKTSLLDYIRSTKIAKNEAGGITQHIGAYRVKTNNGIITFLDTPGHAAFTSMRARGAQVTDIVVLVVAADDGVMPQTIEAIQHAKAAKVPLIVAINKIDKPESNIDHIKQELSKYHIISEDWGGEIQFVYVSAKNGTGINKLLNAILLQAEMLELKAIHSGMASGIVIESSLDKGRGPVATILIQEGILHKGDIVLCGFEYGRIRALRDEMLNEINLAGPSIPVEILGLSNIPIVGDKVTVVRDEKKAREVALYRKNKSREIKLTLQKKNNLENIFSNINNKENSELNIVLKSDVQGSCEAIIDSLLKLSTNEVKINIIGSGVGGITETDATLAAASNAIIIGFNVRVDTSARRIIDTENLDLRYYSVIYTLLNEIKQAMSGMLSPEYKQQIIGLAEVRNIFKSPKLGAIAGCMVIEGIIKRHNPIRILRNHIVIYEGKLESLRRFKEDINEIRNGIECGIGIKNYNDIHINDIIEVFETIEVKRIIT